MKAWVLHNINDLRYESVDKPQLSDQEVLVAVKAAGICGSDIPRIYQTGAHRHPLILGHEFSGVVEKIGAGVEPFWEGKRVGIFPLIPCGSCLPCSRQQYEMCRSYSYLGSRRDGGFAQYAVVPKENLISLPDGVTYEEAAMLEPMAVAVHAMRRIMYHNLSAAEAVRRDGRSRPQEAAAVSAAQAAYRSVQDNVQETAAYGGVQSNAQEMAACGGRQSSAQETAACGGVQSNAQETAACGGRQSSAQETAACGGVQDNVQKTIVVCGLGTIGLLLVMFLLEAQSRRTLRAGRILAVGNKESQRRAVCKMGLQEDCYCDSRTQEAALWIMQQTDGNGADVFFECVGKNETLAQAADCTAPAGRIMLVGNPYSDMQLEKSVYWKILRNQLTIKGTWNSSFYYGRGAGGMHAADQESGMQDDWHYVLKRLAEKRITPAAVISHRYGLEELEQGFRIMRDKTEDYMKIMAIV